MRKRNFFWDHPLKVTLRAGMDRTFRSVDDALDFLENEWPQKRGECYQQAVLSCRQGLNGLAPVEGVRTAFIAACLETGMPVKTAPPPPTRRQHLSWARL